MRKWEKVASDYYSPFWRNYIFVNGFIIQSSLLQTEQVLIGIRSFLKTMDYIQLEAERWEKTFHILSYMVDKDIGVLENILKKTVEIGEIMNDFTERFIKDDLTKYSNKKIISAYEKHKEYNSLEYAWGTLIPFLDFYNYHYLEEKVNNILKVNLKPDETVKAFSVFTQPTEDSFALEQEKSILKIYQEFSNKNIFKKEVDEIIKDLENNYPNIYQKLKKHTKKYSWIYYVYAGPFATEKNFIETIKFYYLKNVNPKKKLQELERERKDLLKNRKEYFNKLNLSSKEKRYVEAISKVIYLKPRRKDYQSKSYYHLEFLQKEIGRRLSLSLNQVRSATLEEIKDAFLNKKNIDINILNERIKNHIIIPKGNKIKIYSGKQAENFSKINIKEEKIDFKNIKEINGQLAYPGHIKGQVKRVDLPEEMRKMEQGDILVSTATAPNIVPAIRKAGAIVTDEGGLTCHAAIVSREFKIPCIVGTKIATKVLKDGDIVEVDASAGTVRILKKSK